MSRLIAFGAVLLLVACGGGPAASPEPTLPATPTAAPSATPTSVSTPTTAPTTAPTDAGSDEPGEPIRLDNYQYVAMIDAEYSLTGYHELLQPSPGNWFYAFEMEFEGIDPDGSAYNPLYFKLEVAGVQHSAALLGKEPTLGSGELQPGQKVIGWLTFEAPEADLVILTYRPVFGLVGRGARWNVTINR